MGRLKLAFPRTSGTFDDYAEDEAEDWKSDWAAAEQDDDVMFELHMSDEELATISIADLRHVLQSFPPDVAEQIKTRRRLLKNRGYAQNTRKRQTSTQSEMEQEKNKLSAEISKLKRSNLTLRNRLMELQEKRVALESHLFDKQY